MYKNLKIVKINSTYCDYLRKYDHKVPKNVRDRCCNFVLLEEKNIEYNQLKEGKKC